MSEAQAAFVLMSLERADYWIDRNKEQHKLYSEKLSKLPGLQILSAQGVSASNYQQIVIATHAINLRTMLSCCLLDNGWQFSALEGLAVKGNMDYASGTDALDLATITLPLGYEVDTKTIDRICAAISLCLGHDSQSRK
jgi:dTDP-4-amino-4,6-dideoxygalactose transaminase